MKGCMTGMDEGYCNVIEKRRIVKYNRKAEKQRRQIGRRAVCADGA